MSHKDNEGKELDLSYGRFDAKPVEEDYNAEARMADREVDIYATRRSSRPSYTRPDPPCNICELYERDRYPEDHPLAGQYPHTWVEVTARDEEGAPTLTKTHVGDHQYAGTVRIPNAKPGYDKATFPIMKKNAVRSMREDDLVSPQGSLWRLQRLIADAKFDLLKQCVAAGVHMVSDIEAEIVVRVAAKSLTDKAGAIVKVKEGVKEVSIFLPNGEFQFGGY